MNLFVLIGTLCNISTLALRIHASIGSEQADTERHGDLHQQIKTLVMTGLRQSRVSFTSNSSNAIHLCVVCTNAGPAQEFGLLLNSLRVHPGDMPYFIHYITDEEGAESMASAINDIDGVYHEGQIFDPDAIQQKLDAMNITVEHHSGLAGMTKTFLLEIFPHVPKCLVVDTDILAEKHLDELYRSIDDFGPKEVMGATWRPQLPWGDKINTGVVAQDFHKMRLAGWGKALLNVYDHVKVGDYANLSNHTLVARWADQTLYHGALMTLYGENDPNVKPQGLHVMDHTWNLEMCQGFYGLCDNVHVNHSIGLLHFNCGWGKNVWWESQTYTQQKDCLLNHGVTGLP